MDTNSILKNKRILICEDSEQLRKAVGSSLAKFGASVTLAADGLEGKAAVELSRGKFDAIITDIRMPGMDGIELLKWSKSTYADIPVMIFTGFSEVLESTEAHDLGASAFIAKPFKLAEFLTAVRSMFETGDEQSSTVEDTDANAHDFCRIPVGDFMSTTRLPSDIYVQVSASKYVKVAREGAEIEVSRLQTYKDRHVEFFFVKTVDFSKYTDLSLRLVKAVERSSRISPSARLELYRHTTEVLVQQIYVQGMSKDLCDEASGLMSNTLKIIGESDDLTELLIMIKSRGDGLYAHGLTVAVYSAMIAKKLGWTTTSNVYKLTLAGMFHDIGLKEIPVELHEKPRAKMTAAEVAIYQTHAGRGRDLMAEFPEFPSDLAQIILQHHENQTGTGYPLGCAHTKIHPLAKVLRVADEFSERMIYSGGKTLKDAEVVLTRLFETKNEEFEAAALAAAFDVFEIPRPAGMRRKAS